MNTWNLNIFWVHCKLNSPDTITLNLLSETKRSFFSCPSFSNTGKKPSHVSSLSDQWEQIPNSVMLNGRATTLFLPFLLLSLSLIINPKKNCNYISSQLWCRTAERHNTKWQCSSQNPRTFLNRWRQRWNTGLEFRISDRVVCQPDTALCISYIMPQLPTCKMG